MIQKKYIYRIHPEYPLIFEAWCIQRHVQDDDPDP
jgi:hypothetical protein